MSRSVPGKHSKGMTVLTALAAVFTVICILLFPNEAFQASLKGLHIWWTIVFPALLPFLVVSELLIAFGFVHALGVWMDPVMRLVFRVPGIGGWAVALSLSALMPSGAQVTAKLRRDGIISRGEAERLLGISHLAGPVIIFSVISVGFMGSRMPGLYIAVIYYMAALLTGILARFLFNDTRSPNAPGTTMSPPASSGILSASLTAMRAAREEDGRSFGKALGDAVAGGIQTLMSIGGLMMIFSVFAAIMNLSSVTSMLAATLSAVLSPVGLTVVHANALVLGWLELHLGAFAAGQDEARSLSFMWSIAAVCAILAWSGLSMHAQVRSLIRDTDIRYATFVLYRLMHSALCIFLTLLVWRPLNGWLADTAPSFNSVEPPPLAAAMEGIPYGIGLAQLQQSLFVMVACMLAIPLATTFIVIVRKIRKERYI
ncbi:hypothetical protein [Paenibacillus swuensis]|uniref:hypothetical protein n=1 Tax=Paenibacillus swuensis TaxID=1178515 RepID=UPI000837E05A|nr:hypothetical protein [Paenibacillus swuensis]